MPRGRKKKFRLNLSPEAAATFVAVLMIISAFFSIISFFVDAPLTNAITTTMTKSFGFASFMIPFILMSFGLMHIRSIKIPGVGTRLMIGLLIGIFSLSGFFHLFMDKTQTLELAQRGVGGGIIGFYISSALESLASFIGAFFILLFLVLASVIFVFNFSFDQMFNFILEISNAIAEKFHFNFSSPFAGAVKESGNKLTVEPAPSVLKNFDSYPNNNSSDLDLDKESEKELPAPSFEVLAPISEPRSSKSANSISSLNSISTPSLPYSDKVYELPPLDILNDAVPFNVDRGDFNLNSRVIVETLNSFGIRTNVVGSPDFGPSVTRYRLETSPGTRIDKIANLHRDLAKALASPTGDVRIEAPIPNSSHIGIEVPNKIRTPVTFKEIILSDAAKGFKGSIPLFLGKDVGGNAMVYDVAKMPHLLVAGSTGSGKSVFLHSLMFSILFKKTPNEVKFILIDPKRVELSHYKGIPHLQAPVITEADKAVAAFGWLIEEMKRRMHSIESAKVRNIEEYNRNSGYYAMPYLVVIVDEMADLMLTNAQFIEKSITRIAQLARFTGIHLVMAVQRPSTNIITGVIKANIPCRISFNVTSQIDSRVVLDQGGAEKLLRKGDMLFAPQESAKPYRLQGALIESEEIHRLVEYLRNSGIEPKYAEDIFKSNFSGGGSSYSSVSDEDEELVEAAIELVRETQQASTTLLQRKLKLGFSRAARIIDILEERRIVGPAEGGNRGRKILIAPKSADEIFDEFESNQE